MKKHTITSNALLLLLCLGLLMMSGCRKDLETDLPGNTYSYASAIPSKERIALLRQSFDGLKNRPSLTGNNAVDFYASLTPLWNSARYMPHTNDSVIYMPLLDPSLLADPYTEIFLTIRDRPAEDEYGLIVFNMDSAYYAGSGITPTLENFTGVVYQVTASGLLRYFNTFSSGRVVKYCEQISDAQHGTGIHVRDETEDCLDGIFGPDCWDPNKGAFWRGVGGFFKGIWAGIVDIVGSQPGDPSGWMGTWFIGGYNVYFDPSNNTPGGGINTNNPNTPPASTWQYLNEVLDGVLFKKAARMAQKLCDQYGLKLPQESFWDIFAAAGIDFIYANEDWTPQKNFNEIALFENAFEELLFLKAIGYELSTPDNSKTPAYTWLKAHPAGFINYLETLSTEYPKMDLGYVVSILSQDLGVTLNDFTSTYEDFLDLDEVNTAPEPEVIQSDGITIGSRFVQPNKPTGLRRIGYSSARSGDNAEDLQYGNNGDTRGIAVNPNLSESVLFLDMDLLFNATTRDDPQMAAIADLFIDRFRNKLGGEYHNTDLTAKVMYHSSVVNYLDLFGKELNKQLKLKNGDINTVPTINMLDNRPKFNKPWDRTRGFQILINDTESTDIELKQYAFNSVSNKWIATLYVEITDHFGLDKLDALTYQHKWFASGFASWWILQHVKGYKPFKTKIQFEVTILGEF